MRTIQIEIIGQKKDFKQSAELNDIKTNNGWKKFSNIEKSHVEKIVYLGNCKQDGDVFSVYHNGYISFVRGQLNDGIFRI